MEDNFMDEEDLVTANPNDRNWKGIIIAVVVIGTVLALIVTSVILLTPPDQGPRVKGKRFELEDVFSPAFQPLRLNGSWISDNEWVFWDSSGGASILSIDKRNNINIRSLIANYTFRQFDAKLFGISADKQYALFIHNIKPVHRHSNTAKYTLYNVESRAVQPINVDRVFASQSSSSNLFRLELVRWSPVGNAIVFVHHGDIYFKPAAEKNLTFRVTDSAVPGVIYNGVPDWLYEEEIFGTNSALWFSPDGESLLYLCFNDTLVGIQPMIFYGDVDDPHIYPDVQELRYPKPGTSNPIVTAKVAFLKGENGSFKTLELQPPEEIQGMDHYITAGGWVRKDLLGLLWTTRSYNLTLISLCSTTSGSCEEIYTISLDYPGWVDTISFPVFTSNPNHTDFITIAPIRDGENGYFDHLVFVDTENRRSYPLTYGRLDVIEILNWDENAKFIYFLGTPATAPSERLLYRLRVEEPWIDYTPECLSCPKPPQPQSLPLTRLPARTNRTTSAPSTQAPNVTERRENGTYVIHEKPQSKSTHPGKPPISTRESLENITLFGQNSSCPFVTAVKFSPKNAHVIIECGGPDIPYVELATVDQSGLNFLQRLQSNMALRNLSNGMAFPKKKSFNVELQAGHTVQVKLLLPPGLREEEITRYPLFLNVYGGPGTQLILDQWGVDFGTYLASKRDFIIAQVDGRGSGGKGWDFQHQIYNKLGLLEAQDQIEVVRYLKEKLHFVDQKKIGIWGWSYGGYLTAMIMTNPDSGNIFPCGASIAPVTNWKLYDSSYTERYMSYPNVTGNYKGYIETDISRNVGNLEKKMFYLLHGTADDNVHLQHSLLLAKALISKQILFRQQIYPDESHNLNGVRLHVHKSLEEFFNDCFHKQSLLEQVNDEILVPENAEESSD